MHTLTSRQYSKTRLLEEVGHGQTGLVLAIAHAAGAQVHHREHHRLHRVLVLPGRLDNAVRGAPSLLREHLQGRGVLILAFY